MLHSSFGRGPDGDSAVCGDVSQGKLALVEFGGEVHCSGCNCVYTPTLHNRLCQHRNQRRGISHLNMRQFFICAVCTLFYFSFNADLNSRAAKRPQNKAASMPRSERATQIHLLGKRTADRLHARGKWVLAHSGKVTAGWLRLLLIRRARAFSQTTAASLPCLPSKQDRRQLPAIVPGCGRLRG